VQMLAALVLASVAGWPGPEPPSPAEPGRSGEPRTGFATDQAVPAVPCTDAPPPPAGPTEPAGADGAGEPARRRPCWPEIWGALGARFFFHGERMAPNGHAYDPLFTVDMDFNLGLLPDQRLYLFGFSNFWAQRAGAGVTNPSQGILDFSRREWDFTAGAAWNVAGPVELRAFGYALNTLNRGVWFTKPAGYADGVGVEGRWYLPTPDRYDVGKRGFLAAGYLPSKTLVDANGDAFAPGLFLRAYLTYDLPAVRSYLFADGAVISDDRVNVRLLLLDAGLASRPFYALPGLEFRLGVADTYDPRWERYNRVLGYGAIRVLF
jgi:hypothetical protein